MGVNSLPRTVTGQRCACDLNPGPSAPESSTLTTLLPSDHYAGSTDNHQICVSTVFFQLNLVWPVHRPFIPPADPYRASMCELTDIR